MASNAPSQITLKRKIDDERTEAPEILYLEGDTPNYFRRVQDAFSPSPKRRNVTTTTSVPAIAAPADASTGVAGAAGAATSNMDDVSKKSMTSGALIATRKTPTKGLRFYLAKKKGKLATFEPKSDVPSSTKFLETSAVSPSTRKVHPETTEQAAPLIATGVDQHSSEVTSKTAESPAVSSKNVFNAMLEDLNHQDSVMKDDASTKRDSWPPRGPRKPAVRLKDRLVKSAPKTETDNAMDVCKDSETRFIYDTYVRVDSMDIDITEAAAGTVGILTVEEEDQPLWETYVDENQDSDEEEASDEDDENAEGYYGADYPEDEMSSDDEFDRNPYQYYHGDSEDEEGYSASPAFDGDDSGDDRVDDEEL